MDARGTDWDAIARLPRRLDRLCSIILNDFLPYYRHWRTDNRAVPQAVLERDRLAHHLWENNFVTANPDGNSYTVIVPA